MVKRFVLPDRPAPMQQLVDPSRRDAFHWFHNTRKRNCPIHMTAKQGEDEMNVVGHDDSYIHCNFCRVIVQSVLECDSSCAGWEAPPITCGECHEKQAILSDDVREISTVERTVVSRDAHPRIVPRRFMMRSISTW